MAKMFVVLTVLSSATAVAYAQAPEGSFAEGGVAHASAVDRAEAFLLVEVARAQFPGGAYALLSGGRVVRSGAFGVVDLDTREPTSVRTRYWIASITKSLTGLALLQLAEAGKLSLDDRVQQHLPWFALETPAASEAVTLRHLLRHETGIPTNAHSVVWHDEGKIRPSLAEGVRALRRVSLRHPPGTAFEYSNMNYAVLGLVVEAVTEQAFESYLEEAILEPLAMTETQLTQENLPPHHATPYIPRFGVLGAGPTSTGRYLAPASSAWSTSRDLGRFAEALLRPKAAPGQGLAELLALSRRDAVATSWPGVSYGYGFNHAVGRSREVAGHLGNASHSSALWVMPREGVGLVLLVGGYSPARTRSIAEGTLQVLVGEGAPKIAGPSDLTALLWLSRAMVLTTALSALLCLTLAWSVFRRVRRGLSPFSRGMALRAGFLTVLAPALFWFGLDGVRQIWRDLPAPTGFGTAPLQGYPAEAALALAGAAFTATAWAAYALFTAVQAYRRRRHPTA